MRIEVDRGLCAGYQRCIDVAPHVFELDDDGIAHVKDGQGGSPADIVDAARACPLGAIRVFDADGKQLAG